MARVFKNSEECKLTPQQVGWTLDQAKRERMYARYVIIIDEEGNAIDFIENPHPQISVLSVVGPAWIGDIFLEETILLEIGLRHSFPYRETGGIRNGSRRRFISPRKKRVSLSMDQLSNVFPKIYEVLVENMREVTSGWKNVVWDMPFQTLGNFDRQTRNRGGMKRIKGVRYSVSFEDEAMLSAVLRSELLGRQKPLEEDMKWAARKIGKIVARYRTQTPTKKQLARMLSAPRLIDLTDFLEGRNFHRHHYHLILENLKRSKGILLFQEILEHMGVDLGEVSDWGTLMRNESAPVFRGVYTWCVADEWKEREKWSEVHQKKIITKHKPQHLSFELSEEPSSYIE